MFIILAASSQSGHCLHDTVYHGGRPTAQMADIRQDWATIRIDRSLVLIFHSFQEGYSAGFYNGPTWVRFGEHLSPEALMIQVRKSPLLVCSICLIAVRHTTQDLATRLAPNLFREAKSLVATSLLTVPQSIEFFQAVLILSLWSTSIGQVPLSIDSWLLTGYALQQGLASPRFANILGPDSRMLSSYAEWDVRVDQPRSQFLQMGYHFALLLTFCQSLRTATSETRNTMLSEMIDPCTSIMNLAVDTTDERTQHLTDHIYHVITFSAITLCRLLSTYEDKLRDSHDPQALDALVTRLVVWLRSIGLSCHVAHMLSDVVSAQHKKLRPGAQPVAYAASDADHSVTTDWAFM